jgi:CRP-like cAMP-binding protein
VAERLAHHLETTLENPIKPGTSLDLTLTQAQLAARLGTVRELCTRAFSQLEERGVILRVRSRVMIRDPSWSLRL